MSNYDENNNPQHVYYDINIVNQDIYGSYPNPHIKFAEVRNTPYLKNAANYFMSVVRFALETPSLPLFIPIIQTGQSNPNLTAYQFNLTYTYSGTTYEAPIYLAFAPQNIGEPTPAAPTTAQDLTSTYYYVNSYEYFLSLVNATLAACYTQLNTAVTGAGGVLCYHLRSPHTLHSTTPPIVLL
jgi:hypothetical protein